MSNCGIDIIHYLAAIDYYEHHPDGEESPKQLNNTSCWDRYQGRVVRQTQQIIASFQPLRRQPFLALLQCSQESAFAWSLCVSRNLRNLKYIQPHLQSVRHLPVGGEAQL